jgi:hypothetical protein
MMPLVMMPVMIALMVVRSGSYKCSMSPVSMVVSGWGFLSHAGHGHEQDECE